MFLLFTRRTAKTSIKGRIIPLKTEDKTIRRTSGAFGIRIINAEMSNRDT
jgi:hypothetical protein